MGIFYCDTEGCGGYFRSVDLYHAPHAPHCGHYKPPAEEKVNIPIEKIREFQDKRGISYKKKKESK